MFRVKGFAAARDRGNGACGLHGAVVFRRPLSRRGSIGKQSGLTALFAKF